MFSRTDDLPDDCEPTTTFSMVSEIWPVERGLETYNLWEVQGVIPDSVEDQILELIDHTEEILP